MQKPRIIRGFFVSKRLLYIYLRVPVGERKSRSLCYGLYVVGVDGVEPSTFTLSV